jgi:hypothetical protein
MDRMPLGLDELVEHRTLPDDERGLATGKRGATRLGFAFLLKFFTQHGRSPSGRKSGTHTLVGTLDHMTPNCRSRGTQGCSN